LDSSLKRHTALIKRVRQSMGSDNREQIQKDIDTLTLEKYIDEIGGAVVEGLSRCKTERDVWGAVEVCRNCSDSLGLTCNCKGHFQSAPSFPKVIHSWFCWITFVCH
jgi:hypothetical protein